jgi:hypothetical protein
MANRRSAARRIRSTNSIGALVGPHRSALTLPRSSPIKLV